MGRKSTREAEDTVAVATGASAEVLAQLNAMFPQGDTYNRTKFPKLVFKSQTVLDEDENVIIKAGTFFIERETDEVDDKGKNKWESTEIGKTLDVHIIFTRKRLQYWDAKAEEFYSTPMYDEDTEVIPLFKAGQFVMEGTPAQLKAAYPKVVEFEDKKTGEKKEKIVSKLDDSKVLYILVDGELLELTIRGSSMWSFNDYMRKFAPQSTITTLNSTKEEAGSNKWNKMSFKPVRNLTQDEAVLAVNTIEELRDGIQAEKEFYASKRATASAGTTAPSIAPAKEALALEAADDEEEEEVKLKKKVSEDEEDEDF